MFDAFTTGARVIVTWPGPFSLGAALGVVEWVSTTELIVSYGGGMQATLVAEQSAVRENSAVMCDDRGVGIRVSLPTARQQEVLWGDGRERLTPDDLNDGSRALVLCRHGKALAVLSVLGQDDEYLQVTRYTIGGSTIGNLRVPKKVLTGTPAFPRFLERPAVGGPRIIIVDDPCVCDLLDLLN